MRVIPTTQWHSTPANTAGLGRQRALGILIHHTAGPNLKIRMAGTGEMERACALAREVQRQHQRQNRWIDIGYHFIVSRGGIILEGRTGSLDAAQRGLVVRGAHAGNNEANARWWGVVLEGSYMEVFPLEDQWVAAVDLCAHLSLWGTTQAQEIRGHRDFKATECPGQQMYDALERFREEVRDRKLQLKED